MKELFIFLSGFLAAFLGSMAGGGAGFISIVALLFIGMPLPVVIATNRLGDLGFYPMAIRNFANKNHIKRNNLKSIISINLVGVIAGTFIVIEFNQQLLRWIILYSLIFVLIFFICKSEIGNVDGKKHWWWSPVFLLASLYGGLVGASTGAFYMFVLTVGRGMTALSGAAHIYAGVFPSVIISTCIFLVSGLVDIKYGVLLIVGNLLGSHFGSKIALKKGNEFVRKMLMSIISLAVVRLWFM